MKLKNHRINNKGRESLKEQRVHRGHLSLLSAVSSGELQELRLIMFMNLTRHRFDH